MSHEIRTPMNGIIGMANLLKNTALVPAQADLVDTLCQSGEALVTIINEVLDFSKIEAGRIELECIEFRPVEQLRLALDLQAEAVRQQGLTMRLDIDPGFPEWVRGDPIRFRQILLNLIVNAIKFTPAGTVTVGLSLVDAGTAGPVLRIEVSDTGIGIPEAIQRKLFQPFVQADSSTTRRYGGTGLGLAICKRLVELMHGEIGLRSTPEVGSTFWFTLPFAPPRQGGFTSIGVRAHTPGLSARPRGTTTLEACVGATAARCPSPLRILVAEDNPVNQKVMLLQLRNLGYSADVVSNGMQALEALRRYPYPVILMDAQMPQMDGLEATRRIRAAQAAGGDEVPAVVHVIAVTANAMSGDRELCLSAGMDNYLSKPVRPELLRAVLAQYLPVPLGGPSTAEHSEAANERGDYPAIFNREPATSA